MNMQRTSPVASSVALSLAVIVLLHAQALAAESTVSGTGVEVIRRPPEVLRMRIEISAKGKTLAEALRKLAARRETALQELAKMSSDKEETRAGEARVNSATSDRQRQIEMMVRQRMLQAGKKSKKAAKKPVSVSCTVTSEWKLQGKTAEELLLEAQAIEDKMRGRSGRKEFGRHDRRRGRARRGNGRRGDDVQ